MEQPFGEEPRWQDSRFTEDAPVEPEPAIQGSNLVGQVRVVAVLLMIQGALELLMGLALLALGAAMPVLSKFTLAQDSNVNPSEAAETQMGLAFAGLLYAALGVPLILSAVLRLIAGWRNYRFRSRMLGVAALICGSVASLMGCYCAPTGIILAIYGLIVYFNPYVAAVFESAAAEPADVHAKNSMTY